MLLSVMVVFLWIVANCTFYIPNYKTTLFIQILKFTWKIRLFSSLAPSMRRYIKPFQMSFRVMQTWYLQYCNYSNEAIFNICKMVCTMHYCGPSNMQSTYNPPPRPLTQLWLSFFKWDGPALSTLWWWSRNPMQNDTKQNAINVVVMVKLPFSHHACVCDCRAESNATPQIYIQIAFGVFYENCGEIQNAHLVVD